MITAEEAREIYFSHKEQILKEIEVKIRHHAKHGERICAVAKPSPDFEDYIRNELIKNGFMITPFSFSWEIYW